MLELTVYITEDEDTDFPYQAIKTLELDDTAIKALAEAIDAIRPTPLGADPAIGGQSADQERDAGLLKPGS